MTIYYTHIWAYGHVLYPNLIYSSSQDNTVNTQKIHLKASSQSQLLRRCLRLLRLLALTLTLHLMLAIGLTLLSNATSNP